MRIEASKRINKRFVAIFKNGKRVDFGQKGGKTYIDEGDEQKRQNYLKRHAVNENWNDPYSPGSLSKWILWGDSKSFNVNHQTYMKIFDKIIDK